MRLIKDNPIIDPLFVPNQYMDYTQYFSRAMLFAQTNYHQELSRLANAYFKKLVPTTFFSECVWNICCVNSNAKDVSGYIKMLNNELLPYYHAFADEESFDTQKLMIDTMATFIDEGKVKAIIDAAQIISEGISLFTWKRYRDNFLNTSKKLQALPMINESNVVSLSFDIGLHTSFDDPVLETMADHWKFISAEEMCKALAQQFVMQPREIGLVLWYAYEHFGKLVI